MRIRVGDLKDMIARDVRASGRRQHLREADEHIEFRQGETMTLHRPVRVTPLPGGGYEGGEDSPGSRRPNRPRGTTSAILRPGTRIKVLRAGKNEAWVQPTEEDGSPVVDPRTGNEVDRVKVHINKVCPHCATGYKAGRARGMPPPGSLAAAVAATKPAPEQGLDDEIAQAEAELQRMIAARRAGKAPKAPAGPSGQELPDDYEIEFEPDE